MTQKSVHTERRGDGLRGTTRLCCARISATSRSDPRSDWLVYGGQSAKPTRTQWSFGQQLQGDLRRCAGRGSHCLPIALPAPSGYSSLSQHLRYRVYFRAGAYCNCVMASRAFPYCSTRLLQDRELRAKCSGIDSGKRTDSELRPSIGLWSRGYQANARDLRRNSEAIWRPPVAGAAAYVDPEVFQSMQAAGEGLKEMYE
jgi:hypothetical protein